MQASLERLRRRREELGDEGGFTLIELLIVIVILGILAAIVVFAVQNLTGSSVQASCRTDFKTVESAMETYKAQMGAYPTGIPAAGTTQADFTPAAQTAPALPATDVDPATAPTWTAGSTPGGTNVASATAGAGAELLTGSDYNGGTGGNAKDQSNADTQNLTAGGWTSTNKVGVGPWLKDIPQNSGHYIIWASNDGSGQIAVLDGNSHLVQDTTAGAPNSGKYNDAGACGFIH